MIKSNDHDPNAPSPESTKMREYRGDNVRAEKPVSESPRARRRRRNARPDTFTTGEIAPATALPLRSVIHLCEIGLLPSTGGHGRGAKRELSVEALGRVAAIAALHQAGVPIVTGARLIEALAADDDIGVKIGGLQHLLQKPHNPNTGHLPFDVEVLREHDLNNPFWQHYYFSKHSTIYKRNTAFAYDNLLEIVDCKWCFSNALVDQDGTLTPLRAVSPGSLMVEIEGWGTKHVTATNLPLNALSAEGAKMIRQQFRGLITANVSLMMRDVLDAIEDLRPRSD
jgi:hypothetical protein